jgi:hypothetical protein
MERAEWLLVMNVECKLLAMGHGWAFGAVLDFLPRCQLSRTYPSSSSRVSVKRRLLGLRTLA